MKKICLLLSIFCCLNMHVFSQDSSVLKIHYPQILVKLSPMGLFHPIHYVSVSTEVRFNRKHAYELEFGFINRYTGIPYRSLFDDNELDRYGFRMLNSYKYYFLSDVTRRNTISKVNQYIGFDLQTSMHQVKTELEYCRFDCSYNQLFPATQRTITLGFGVKYGLLIYAGKKNKGIIDFYSGLGYIAYKRKLIQNIPDDASRVNNINFRLISFDNEELLQLLNIIIGIKFGYRVN